MKKVTKLIIVGMALCASAFFMSCANSAGGYAVGSDEYNAIAAAAAAAASAAAPSGSTTPAVAETYTLNIANCPTTAETTKVVDSTISVVAAASGKKIENKSTYLQMTGGKASATAGVEYGLKVTLTKTASTITIKASSKESKAANQWIMKGASGASDVTSTGTPATAPEKGNVSNVATLTFSSVPAGTYYLGASADGGYLTSLVITY